MVAQQLFQGERLLICLFLICHEVSAFRDDCWEFTCTSDFFHHICTCKSQLTMPSWQIVMIVIVPVIIFVGCCIKLCLWFCKKKQETCLSEGSLGNQCNPPSFINPAVATASSHHELRDPPPYREIAWEPYHYLPPQDGPPAYDNIAMDTIALPDVTRIQMYPESEPKDNSRA